jgi:hypothetical protein
VYFGDAPKSDDGDGVLVPSIVTAGNTFAIDIFIENEGNQRLTHSEVGYGSLAVARTDTNDPSLPAGATIFSATLDGQPCTITEDLLGALCDLGQFDSGEIANVQFIVNAPSSPGATATWASFKVAENVPDQGANRNTFYADAHFVVGPTNSNSNATYKTGGEFSLSTNGPTLVKKDSMTTTVFVPGGGVGAISISETDCDDTCTGQIATVHVRDGALQTPYLEWTLVITGSLGDPVVVTHELDSGLIDLISEADDPCSDPFVDDCMDSVTRQGNMTRIVLKTGTNGRVKAG